MFRKRTFALSCACGLLLVLWIFHAIATPLLQGEKTEPADVSGGAERLPIKLLKRTFETAPSYTEEARKNLFAVRMKRSGARWKERTGEHVVQLRALALSDRWLPAMDLTLRPLRKAVRAAA